MQDVTPWPDSFEVSQPVARVLVDGQEVDIESVTVSSEFGSAAPEWVAAGGGGMVAATGSAAVIRPDPVAEAGFNPWGDASRLVGADEVVVEAGFYDSSTGEVGCARQITAQINKLDGAASSGEAHLDFMDHTPQLDRNITIEPLLEIYPPAEDGSPFRRAGLSSLYVTNRVLRHCGFYTTPPDVPGVVVGASLFGSAWPEHGRLLEADPQSGPESTVRFVASPWGLGMSNGVMKYAPDFGDRGHGYLSSTLHVSFCLVARDMGVSGTGRVEIRWGSSNNTIRVEARPNGTLAVVYRGNGTNSLVTVLPASDVASSETFTVLIRTSGEATIYASNGGESSGTVPLPSQMTISHMSDVIVQNPRNAYLFGGLQVGFNGSVNRYFERTAHFLSTLIYEIIRAFPSQIGANCLDLLKEQADAELAAMWIDEYGHFRWMTRWQLRQRTPVGTITSTQNLLDLSWSHPARSQFSRVEVTHSEPTISRRTVASITVAEGRGSRLSSGDDEHTFYEPAADQDWHEVEAPRWLGGSIDYPRLRRGQGSYHGGVVVDDDDNESMAFSSRLVQSWSQINPQRWLLSSQALELTTVEQVEQRFRDRPDLYGSYASENLPIIRAKALTEWNEHTTVGEKRGPVHAPVLDHRVGPWVQNANSLKTLADWLAEELTTPAVVLKRVPIIPDPRIQLGDVFWLEDQTAYHVRLRVVIVGIELSYQTNDAGHEMSQQITCRVVSGQRLKASYDELEIAWEGQDYMAFDDAWSDATYTAFEADPLYRS